MEPRLYARLFLTGPRKFPNTKFTSCW